MQLLSKAARYKTYNGAKKKLERHVDLDKVNWMILAQEDGTFTPAVFVVKEPELTSLVHVGIGVVGY